MTADEDLAAMEAQLDEAAQQSAEPPRKENVVLKLADLIRETFQLVHEAGRPYAVAGNGARDLLAVTRDLGIYASPGIAVSWPELRRIIVRLGRAQKLATVTRNMADTVLLQLEADAFNGVETELALRFHHQAGRVVLDLGGWRGQCVVIEPGKWAVGPVPAGVTFKRSHAIRQLPEPKHQDGVTLASLAGLLALDPGSDAFGCLLGWLIGLAFAGDVRPGLLLTGAPGSAKSTRLRHLVSVVEPSAPDALGGAFGRNHGDDEVRALRRAVPLYDNVTAVSGTTSDLLCTIITGTAREGRLLYSNDDMSTAKIRRPMGLTAVATPAGLRPDALDRLIVCELEPPAVLRGDGEVQAEFDAMHPGLLAAWCDAVAAVLAWLPHVPGPGSYRMAAHAHVLAALDAAMGQGYLLDAYAANVRQARQRAASDDVFGAALLELLARRPVTRTAADEGRAVEFREWRGTATELLTAAVMLAGPGDLRAPGWPSTPKVLGHAIGSLRGPLAECGLTWKTGSTHGKTRYEFTLCSEKQV